MLHIIENVFLGRGRQNGECGHNGMTCHFVSGARGAYVLKWRFPPLPQRTIHIRRFLPLRGSQNAVYFEEKAIAVLGE